LLGRVLKPVPVFTLKNTEGKGSKARPGVYTKEYRDNFDRIFGHAKKKKHNKKEK
jgi:hypothetical protein